MMDSVEGTGVRVHLGAAILKFGHFFSPSCVSFRRDTKSSWSLLPGVSVPGEVKDPTQGKWKNLSWNPRANGLNLQRSIWAVH